MGSHCPGVPATKDMFYAGALADFEDVSGNAAIGAAFLRTCFQVFRCIWVVS
jgi:hypothetical protein